MNGLLVPGELLASAAPRLALANPTLIPIATPLSFSGFNEATLQQFQPYFDQMGVVPALGGTVAYNDGKRVLGFGHSFFNLGPVSMPMSGGEIVHVLSSSYQPNKFANATGIVGALRQDRHSGIMGVLGEAADMIPVSLPAGVAGLGDHRGRAYARAAPVCLVVGRAFQPPLHARRRRAEDSAH